MQFQTMYYKKNSFRSFHLLAVISDGPDFGCGAYICALADLGF
jgi:hypothetical protein